MAALLSLRSEISLMRPHPQGKVGAGEKLPPRQKSPIPIATSTTPQHHIKMRPLAETETQTLFAKLANHTGKSLKNLIAPLDNELNADRYVFHHQSRCYYV
jgi:hypothetical protein